MVDLFTDIPDDLIESTLQTIRENLDKVGLFGGHTLRRHTDIQLMVLKSRLTKEDIRYATSYWDTLEVEPGGVIRQKRTEYDRQNKDIEAASAFLREWQLEIQKRITENDRELANRSRQLRMESYAEMRKKKVKINGGLFQGKYLADVLEADLMEMPDTLQQAA